MASASAHGGFPIGGNGLGQAQQGSVSSGHRGGGFMPMAAHGSAARVMSPRARTPGSKRGPGSRHGSAEQGNSPQAMETGSAAKRADRERDRDRNRSMRPQETADWDKLIGDIHHRLDTVERNIRNNAQHTANLNSKGEQLQESLRKDYPA